MKRRRTDLENEEKGSSAEDSIRSEDLAATRADEIPYAPDRLAQRRNEHGDDGGGISRPVCVLMDLEDEDDVEDELPSASCLGKPSDRQSVDK